MWPNVLNMFGIGKQKGIDPTQSALSQGGQFDTELGTASSNVTGSQPAQQGPREAINWENLLKTDGQPLQMRNVEPAVDPLTGKPELFKGNAPMAEAPQTPNTAGTEKSNSIWGKLKDFSEGYQERMEDRGLINPAFQKQENPNGPSDEDKELSDQLKKDIESGGNIDANRFRSDSSSKQNYQENIQSHLDYQASPEGQAYGKATQEAMDAGNKSLPGGAVGQYINRMFNPNANFKWNIDKKMKYDTPPEFR